MQVQFDDRAIYLPESDTLVVSDLHFGRGRVGSVSLVISESADMIARITQLLDRFNPSTVVISGDTHHMYTANGNPPDTAQREFMQLYETIAGRVDEVVIVLGNHEFRATKSFRDSLPGTVVESYRCKDGETVICHGHRSPTITGENYIIGHLHPAVKMNGQMWPCYLVGPDVYYGKHDVLVLPSFNRAVPGVPMNTIATESIMSPVIGDSGSIGKFRVLVWDDGAQDYSLSGSLRDIRGQLDQM